MVVAEKSRRLLTRSAVPQIHFNIQIHLPENGSPEDYDAIFKSIGTYLLGRKDEQ